MPVFNTAANQVLSQPVSNYYQGKAIRLQQQMQQKELDTYDDKIDLERRRVEVSERNAAVNEGTLEQRVAEYEGLVGQETAKKNAWDLFYSVADVNRGVQEGRYSEEEALQRAVPKLLDYADSLPEEAKEQADGIREAIQDRDGLTLEEWQEIGASAEGTALYYGFVGKEEPFVLADGAELYDAAGNRIASNPKDFDPNSGGSDRVTFDPPNAAELEVAKKIVKKEFDLDGRYIDEATMWLANEVRNIQERDGEDYNVAVAMAIAKMKAKLSKERDFFSGSDDKINYLDDGLASNEYLVRGEVWVKEADGSVHLKNP